MSINIDFRDVQALTPTTQALYEQSLFLNLTRAYNAQGNLKDDTSVREIHYYVKKMRQLMIDLDHDLTAIETDLAEYQAQVLPVKEHRNPGVN